MVAVEDQVWYVGYREFELVKKRKEEEEEVEISGSHTSLVHLSDGQLRVRK